MLFVLNCVLITLASAATNNISSKPSDNKVSGSLYCVKLKKEGKKKTRKERTRIVQMILSLINNIAV